MHARRALCAPSSQSESDMSSPPCRRHVARSLPASLASDSPALRGSECRGCVPSCYVLMVVWSITPHRAVTSHCVDMYAKHAVTLYRDIASRVLCACPPAGERSRYFYGDIISLSAVSLYVRFDGRRDAFRDGFWRSDAIRGAHMCPHEVTGVLYRIILHCRGYSCWRRTNDKIVSASNRRKNRLKNRSIN